MRKPLGDASLPVKTVSRYGHAAETLANIARAAKATQVFVGRTGDAKLAARLFGLVAGTLAQIAPAPCTIVP